MIQLQLAFDPRLLAYGPGYANSLHYFSPVPKLCYGAGYRFGGALPVARRKISLKLAAARANF